MPNNNIKVTDVGDFVVFNQPSGSNDPAVWRREDLTVPPMYRPTITQTARSNKTGTNVNVMIKVAVPVVDTDVSGKKTSNNTVIAQATVTSLQNIVGDHTSHAIDALIAALTQQKASIIAGKTA